MNKPVSREVDHAPFNATAGAGKHSWSLYFTEIIHHGQLKARS